MAEPITVAELKAHLRLDHSDQDVYLATLIAAAREELEAATWKGFVLTARTVTLRSFPIVFPCGGSWRSARNNGRGDNAIYLPFPPLQSVTSIVYLDSSGVAQTLSPSRYVVSPAHWPGTIEPVYGDYWPDVREHPAAVTITFQAGYADAASVPAMVKHALKLIAGENYEHSEPTELSKASGGIGTTRTTLDRIIEKLCLRHDGILECV